MARILIVGGYGAFGERAVERLARREGIELVIAGRDGDRAARAAARLARACCAAVRSCRLDATAPDTAELARIAPSVVVNASGPYQAQDYRLARAAMHAGAHYVDLADARAFVTGIAALDAEARARGVLLVSGASSVPGLSAAVVDHYRPQFARLTALTYGISPGNSYHPGPATAASILSYAGRPIATRMEGREQRVWGWQSLHRRKIAGLGARWLANCDIPDLDIFPRRYPDLATIRFFAGVEVPLFQLAIWALSWAARGGLVARPERLAPSLLALKRRFAFLGSDVGGMFVTLEGIAPDGGPHRIDWTLVAASGHGPYVPVAPAVVVASKLARGAIAVRGAQACIGLCTLDELLAEVADLDISTRPT